MSPMCRVVAVREDSGSYGHWFVRGPDPAYRPACTGPAAHVHLVDVADARAMEEFAATVARDHGVPDIVANNAGIGLAGSFLDTSEADWERILGVNLRGVIHGCRLFGLQMARQGTGGRIVNIASAAAFMPSRALPAYSTTKAVPRSPLPRPK
jgi:NAD(P)-dependent dehydrogenase (short-subunit alcohol dehydrogenase family)